MHRPLLDLLSEASVVLLVRRKAIEERINGVGEMANGATSIVSESAVPSAVGPVVA